MNATIIRFPVERRAPCVAPASSVEPEIERLLMRLESAVLRASERRVKELPPMGDLGEMLLDRLGH